MTKRKDKVPAAALTVYSGQDYLGFVLEVGTGFASYTAAGDFIGAFKTLQQASRAIDPAREES